MIALFVWTISDVVGLVIFALFFAAAGLFALAAKISDRKREPIVKCRLCGRQVTGEYAAMGRCGMCGESPRQSSTHS